jgi:hypothetical protein
MTTVALWGVALALALLRVLGGHDALWESTRREVVRAG